MVKNTIYEIKSSITEFNSRLDMEEARIGILENSSVENTKCVKKRKWEKVLEMCEGCRN